MASEPRAVFDANVMLSALLLPRSVPRKAFDQAVSMGRVLLSEPTLHEFNNVVARPKFRRYISVERRTEFLQTLVRDCELVTVTTSVQDCRDPKDNMYLELALDGRATHIVSGDGDLLVLNLYHGIAILSPQNFLAEMAQ